jgi:Mn-dependent DtxR family transcriptional regulator
MLISEIADRLKKSSTTTSKYLEVLEAKGIVKKDVTKNIRYKGGSMKKLNCIPKIHASLAR